MAANPSGENGPRAKATTGRGRGSLTNMLSKYDRDRTPLNAATRPQTSAPTGAPEPEAKAALAKLKQMRENRKEKVQTPDTFRPTITAPQLIQPRANLTALAYAAMRTGNSGGGGGNLPTGPTGGPLMAQLAAGFRKAGDDKMARFVLKNPQLMRTWLGAESGLDFGAISPPNNQGDPNYGGFQFARLDPGARPWLEKFIKRGGRKFTATPFQQAILAAKYFDLTPRDVRGYVQQINQGTYQGWG